VAAVACSAHQVSMGRAHGSNSPDPSRAIAVIGGTISRARSTEALTGSSARAYVQVTRTYVRVQERPRARPKEARGKGPASDRLGHIDVQAIRGTHRRRSDRRIGRSLFVARQALPDPPGAR